MPGSDAYAHAHYLARTCLRRFVAMRSDEEDNITGLPVPICISLNSSLFLISFIAAPTF